MMMQKIHLQSEVSASSQFTHGNYTGYQPYFYELAYNDNKERKYKPFDIDEDYRFGPDYQLPRGIEPTIPSLSELILPDHLIDTILKQSNKYAHQQTRLPPEIPDPKDPKGLPIPNPLYLDPEKEKAITESELLYFFACYYYMGFTKLPSKTDYWTRPGTYKCTPEHWMKDGKFPRDRFLYIWRNIHLEEIEPTSLSTKEDFDDIEEEDDGNIEPTPAKMTHQEYDEEQREHWEHDDDSEEQANNDDEHYDTSSDYDTDTEHKDERNVDLWYQKVKIFLDHVNKISQKCCKHPSFALSINEMMKLFKGRSNMTFRMKKKPIKEGFKFFCDV